MKILITGANGQLGMSFRKIAPQHPEHNFSFFGSKQLDITSPSSIQKAFKETQPDVIINCAAYTAVDRAEDEPEKAYTVNAEGVKNIVNACKEFNSALIHISTDYVFDGMKGSPYTESDETNPINVYGESKLAGEQHVINSNLKSLVIRASWVYSEYGSNFVKTMLRLGKERASISVVDDQLGSPTYAGDLAEACLIIIGQQEKWVNERKVYHYSNEGSISWYEFAQEIMCQAKLNCIVNPVNSESYPTRARRPHYAVLNCSLIRNRFILDTKPWRESLKEIFP